MGIQAYIQYQAEPSNNYLWPEVPVKNYLNVSKVVKIDDYEKSRKA